jgi:cytoplasmic iron level regulating protein YaaA (DUF328/UPF0246 family)
MLAITSPAKTQDFDSQFPGMLSTKPEFTTKVDTLVAKLKKLTKKELAALLGVSDDLALLNYTRFRDWNQNSDKQAILAYKGDIYRQFDAESFTKTEQQYVQSHLRIITGLYGILRPYDRIKPYRLEMKTKIDSFNIEDFSKLQDYWRNDITAHLNNKLLDFNTNERILINLASNEYADAVDFEKINSQVLEIEFRQRKNGELVNYGIYAKFARGLFIRYMVENSITSKKDLEGFNIDGYSLYESTEEAMTFVKSID